MIVKSKEAAAPSDLTRTDWIDFDPADEARFRRKLNQALDELDEVAAYQETLLQVALAAPSIDCAVAFERANKAFLLTRQERFLTNAEEIARRLEGAAAGDNVDDLERLRGEVALFVTQGRRAIRPRA